MVLIGQHQRRGLVNCPRSACMAVTSGDPTKSRLPGSNTTIGFAQAGYTIRRYRFHIGLKRSTPQWSRPLACGLSRRKVSLALREPCQRMLQGNYLIRQMMTYFAMRYWSFTKLHILSRSQTNTAIIRATNLEHQMRFAISCFQWIWKWRVAQASSSLKWLTAQWCLTLCLMLFGTKSICMPSRYRRGCR